MIDSFELPPCVGDNKPSLGSYADPLAFARTTFSQRGNPFDSIRNLCVTL